MPNGGSDCCARCRFYSISCLIRGVRIENPAWTYCANILGDPIPIGPITRDSGEYPYRRETWIDSPDTEEIRQHLLDLLGENVENECRDMHPISPNVLGIVIWQLGEFGEKRAEEYISWISENGPERLLDVARTALEQIRKQRNTVSIAAYEGGREYLTGYVSSVFDFNLLTRMSLSEDSVSARTVSNKIFRRIREMLNDPDVMELDRIFPRLQVTQIRFLVDEASQSRISRAKLFKRFTQIRFLVDETPDAVDVWSYDAWCPTETVPEGLAKGQSVGAIVSSTELPSIGNRWVVESIERL